MIILIKFLATKNNDIGDLGQDKARSNSKSSKFCISPKFHVIEPPNPTRGYHPAKSKCASRYNGVRPKISKCTFPYSGVRKNV